MIYYLKCVKQKPISKIVYNTFSLLICISMAYLNNLLIYVLFSLFLIDFNYILKYNEMELYIVI